MFSSLFLLLALLSSLGRGERMTETPRYSITDLGEPPHPGDMRITSLNDRGQVVGYTYTPGIDTASNATYGFIWGPSFLEPNPPHLLRPVSGVHTLPLHINARGDAVGHSDFRLRQGYGLLEEKSFFAPAIWLSYSENAEHLSEITPLALSAQSGIAYASNSARTIVGSQGGAVMWQGKKRRMIWKGEGKVASGINEQGDIIGYCNVSNYTSPNTPFLSRKGKRLLLGTLNDRKEGACHSINQRGEVVGWSFAGRSERHACLWKDISAHPVAPIDLGEGEARSINDAGEIVGDYWQSTPLGTFERACLWREGKRIDLNTCLPPASGWTLHQAVAINNRGQIAGTGLYQGKERGFLLTPSLQNREGSRQDGAISPPIERSKALIQAIKTGQTTTITQLVAAGGDVNYADAADEGMTPLMYAVMQAPLDTIQLLLRKGARVNDTSCTGLSALLIALMNRRPLALIQELLRYGAEVNLKRTSGSPPLFWALDYEESLDVAKRLVEYGADVNITRPTGETDLHEDSILHHVLRRNREETEFVSLLIAKGARVNTPGMMGQRPLHIACSQNYRRVAKILLAHGADVNGRDAYQAIPLMNACDSLAMVKLLVAHGADTQGRDKEGRTVLAHAALQGSLAVCQYLLARGADLHARSKTTRHTALLESARSGSVQKVRLLLAYGARLDERTAEGRTALELAAQEGDVATVRFLLRSRQVRRDKVALNQALFAALEQDIVSGFPMKQFLWGTPRTLRVLVEAGASLSQQNSERQTPFQVAVSQALRGPPLEVLYYAPLEFLLQSGSAVNHPDKEGRTALMYAARQGHRSLTSFLLGNGANPRLRDKRGRTAQDWAKAAGHALIVQMLDRALQGTH